MKGIVVEFLFYYLCKLLIRKLVFFRMRQKAEYLVHVNIVSVSENMIEGGNGKSLFLHMHTDV